MIRFVCPFSFSLLSSQHSSEDDNSRLWFQGIPAPAPHAGDLVPEDKNPRTRSAWGLCQGHSWMSVDQVLHRFLWQRSLNSDLTCGMCLRGQPYPCVTCCPCSSLASSSLFGRFGEPLGSLPKLFCPGWFLLYTVWCSGPLPQTYLLPVFCLCFWLPDPWTCCFRFYTLLRLWCKLKYIYISQKV